ncbi:MAG: prepilin peptidase [Planctomycetes bacterium]|nr:prepilin peptidase [Planctomycetota bacterium]
MLIASIDLLRICVLFGLLVAAAYTDILWGKVYNWATYTGIVTGLLVSLAIGGARPVCPTFLNSLVGLGLGFGLFYLFHLWGGVGMGDVKLMAAIGALMGWQFVLIATFYSTLFGGLISLLLLAYRQRLWDGLKKAAAVLVSPKTLSRKNHVDGTPALTGLSIPYGFATAVGTLCAWFRESS